MVYSKTGFVTQFAALLCLSAGKATAALNSTCKCIPSDPCWPSPQTWSNLNNTLDGRVLPLSLPVTVCPSGGEASETYSVNATNAEHVQAALLFADKYNLKVNVNNTGHSGAGSQRGSSCGAMFIHTHYMKGLDFHNEYTPQSCPSNVTHMAATLGAGEQDDDVFQALAKFDAVTVGGTYKTVGIVGWATSGGHGWLTSSYGQGADNIYEVEIVTPRGEILIANECQNSDIFWASRGGGGGTYGVITRITMKAYPMPKTAVWKWNIQSQNVTSESDWWKLVADVHSLLVGINEKGFQGYYTITGAAKGPWSFGGFFLAYDKTNTTVQQILAPLETKLNASTNVATRELWGVESFDSWIDAYNALPVQTSTDSDSAAGGTVSVTRLLTRDALTKDLAASATMFQNIGPSAEDQQMNLTGRIIAGSMIASPKSVNNALNPAWRDTVIHMIVKGSWSDARPSDEVKQIHERFTNKIGRAMRSASPDSGCYINECDEYEPDWQGSLYGPNYSRLRAIKAKYDPNDLLWCRRCVGSEEWEYRPETGSLSRRSSTDYWSNYNLATAIF